MEEEKYSWLSDRWFYTRHWFSDVWYNFGIWLGKDRNKYYVIAAIVAVALLAIFG